MNRSEIRQLVIDHTGRSDKTTLINSMIDAAVLKVSAEHLWSDLLVEATAVLTIGAASIVLATDLRRMTEFRVLDGLSSYRMNLRSKTFLVQMYPSPTSLSNAKPRFGYLQGNTLFLIPPPDLAYNVAYSYYRLHPKLTLDNSTTIILQADEAIVAYATYRTFKSLQLHEDAAQWLVDYAMLLRDAKSVDRSSAVQHSAIPRGVGEPVPEDYWIDPFVKEVP